ADGKVVGDLRNVWIDGAAEERRGKGDQAHDRQHTLARTRRIRRRAHAMIACGRNRERLVVIAVELSRMDNPQGLPPTTQEPMTACMPAGRAIGAIAWRTKPSPP